MKAKTVTIGYYRTDEDFAILATLNNNDEHLTEEQFDEMIDSIVARLEGATGMVRDEIIVLNRQDAPDYLDDAENDSVYE